MIFLLVFIGACKKEWSSGAETPSSELLNKAKLFFNQQTVSLQKISSANQTGLGEKTNSSTLEEKKAPIWNEAKMEKTTDGRTIMTVPLNKYELDNKAIAYTRKYVFEEHNGNITDGKIIEVIGSTELIDKKGESTITSYKDKHIEGFSGAVISYDLNYSYLEGHYYQNGRQLPSKVRITAKLPSTKAKSSGQGKLASANIPNKISTEIGNDGPGQTCTNWYLYVWYYDQYGDFMYSTETYLGTTCTSGGYVGPPPVGGGSIETVVFDCAGVPNGTAQITPCGCITGAARGTQCPLDTVMTSKFVKNAKAMCALEKLMNNSFFKNTLNNFIGENKPIDLTFNLEPLAPEAGFIRYGTAIPNPITWNSNNIDLTLNENTIDSLASLQVAFTLLHEGIHAEIFRKLLSIHGPSNLNSQNFPSLFEAYRIYNNYQHEFIANYYTDLIGNALWEYDNKKFDISYYKAYSYNGLEKTITYTTFSTSKKSDITSKTTSLLENRNKSNCNDL